MWQILTSNFHLSVVESRLRSDADAASNFGSRLPAEMEISFLEGGCLSKNLTSFNNKGVLGYSCTLSKNLTSFNKSVWSDEMVEKPGDSSRKTINITPR